MKKILLINPWIYDFSAFDLWLKPIGLLYISSFLEKRGFRISYLDCLDRYHNALNEERSKSVNRKYGTGRFHAEVVEKPDTIKSIPRRFKRFGIPYSIVRKELRKEKDADVILITSVMTYWYQGVFEMIKLLRKEIPDAKIILGGIYPTLLTEHALKESGADVVIPGLDFYPLLRELGDNEEKGFMPEEFFNTFSPAYHLYERLPYVSMLTSLGCPFHCTYCVSNLLVKRFFTLSHEKILDEFDVYVKKLKVKDIAFCDDALLYNSEKHFLPLFEEVIKRKYSVRFHTPNGINARFITKDVAEILYKCNFKTIRIGLESCQGDFQKVTGGKVTNEEISIAVSNLAEAGIPKENIGIYIMAGREDEKIDDVIKTLRFVMHLGTKVFVSEYSPVPGSIDWKRVENFKRLDPIWQNNSIAFLKNGWTFEEMQKVKDIKNQINRTD